MKIQFQNVTKIFNKDEESRVVALDNVSFEIEEGKITGLIGKTGSGKSTISNILLGLEKPTEGKVIFDDIEINNKSKRKNLLKISSTVLGNFQNPDLQIFKTSVMEELLFPNNDLDEIKELIKKLNIQEDILEKSPYKISAGQKRKILLASIIAQKPKMIILDESTAYLDTKSREDLKQVIKFVNKEYKTTFIFISHNLEDIKDICEETIVVDSGKFIMKDKSVKAIKKYLGGENE